MSLAEASPYPLVPSPVTPAPVWLSTNHRMAAPMMAPMNWNTMYPTASLASILLSRYMPTVIAGLMWHPDTRPMQ